MSLDLFKWSKCWYPWKTKGFVKILWTTCMTHDTPASATGCCIVHRHQYKKQSMGGYWAWSESLEPIAERLESTDMPRWIRWRRHLKEPACVVGEHRQFHLSLEDFLVAAWDVGDTRICECEWFFWSTTFKSALLSCTTLTLIGGGFFFTFSTIFSMSKLLEFTI